MSLIKVTNLSFSYYGYLEDIFENVSFELDTTWKTGLIGRNGIGKSTFFKLLLGEEKYQGKIDKTVSCIKFPPDISNYNLQAIEIFYELCPNEMEWKLFREINLLNMDAQILYRPFVTLSKGEQTKILLAMLFTKEDGFLLIDEPTNHLDYFGRMVVSEYLKSKEGFLLISHDRDFLDNCVDHIISISKNAIEVQSGNFSSWYENKLRKEQYEISENLKLKKDIKRLKLASEQTELWSNKVEKTKYNTRMSGSKTDKGYIGHKSAKMMKKSKNLEKRQLKAIEEKEKLLNNIDVKENLKLHSLKHHKEKLITVENLCVSYGDKKVLDNLSFEFVQGDRLALLGGNGSGKSTLIKILLGENITHTGNVNIASDLQISYIPQDTSHLQGSLDDYIDSQDIDKTLCMTILRKMGFSRELFESNLENYSDGQKKKVLIASSLSKEAHIFIWDEPLNYIDIISRMQIEEIILLAKPSLIFVEHDKQFRDNIATKVINL